MSLAKSFVMFAGYCPAEVSAMEETLKSNLFKLASMMNGAGVSDERIGRLAIKSNTFFQRLREGGGFTVRIYDEVVKWISENWPETLEWPDGIDRPVASLKETVHGE